MSERAGTIAGIGDEQVAELLDLLAAAADDELRRPCPGREKLGDGSIVAVAWHAVQNYGRIARFAAGDQPAEQGAHDASLSAERIDRAALLAAAERARKDLGVLATLGDDRLDAVPPPDAPMRFCDGKRTLERVLDALLTHQAHNVAAVRRALAPGS